MSKFRKILIACWILVSAPAYADRDHYVNFHQGANVSGMGGANATITDDVSALYYNPAGIVVNDSQVAATYNGYFVSEVSYERFIEGLNWAKRSNISMPGMFGITKNYGSRAIGFVFLTDDAISEDQREKVNVPRKYNESSVVYDAQGEGVSFVMFSKLQELNAYVLGPSFAYALSNGFNIGIGLHGTYRTDKSIISQTSNEKYKYNVDSGGNTTVYSIANYNSEYYEINNTELGVKPSIGVQYVGKKLRFGLNTSREFGLSRDFEYRYSMVSGNLWNATSESNYAEDNDADSAYKHYKTTEVPEYPFRIALGLGYSFEKIFLSFDLAYYSAATQNARSIFIDENDNETLVQSDCSAESLEKGNCSFDMIRAYDLDRKAVCNLAIGMEFQSGNNSIYRLGLFTNKHNVDTTRIDLINDDGESEYKPEATLVDTIGITASYTLKLEKDRQITIGATYSEGKGRAYTGSLLTNSDLTSSYYDGDDDDSIEAKATNYGLYISVQM